MIKLLCMLSITLLVTLAYAAADSIAAPGTKPHPQTKDSLAGFDTIAGDLPGVVVAKAKPYLVAGDIYVPQGKTVIIEAGAIFLFKSFTGMHVTGVLLARGLKDKPIIFTSENDREYNRGAPVDAAPFDWNGIYIHEDGIGSQLAYCAVMYAVEGLTSQTKFIRLEPCLFLHNGRANCSIEGKVQQVTDQPFEYALSATDPSLKGIPLAVLKDPLKTSRTVFRLSGSAACVAGGIMAIAWGSKFSAANGVFNDMSRINENNLAHNSSAAWNTARLNKNRDFAALVAGCAVTAVGAMGVAWSFIF